jgi:hypothetical protein
MVKMLQHMKRVTLSCRTKPKKQDPQCCDEDGNPDPDAFDTAVFAWKEDNKSIKSRRDKYKYNESNAWTLIYDQCSPKLKNKIEGMEGCNGAKSANNVAKLLTMIQGFLPIQPAKQQIHGNHSSNEELVQFFQKGDQLNAVYHKDFIAMLEVIEEYGGAGSLTHFPNMPRLELKGKGIDLSKARLTNSKNARRPFARSSWLRLWSRANEKKMT